MKKEWNVTCINRNARPNNNQLITYGLCVRYLLRIQEYPVNTTYNKVSAKAGGWGNSVVDSERKAEENKVELHYL